MRERGARFGAALPNQEVSRQREQATGTGEMRERGARFCAAVGNQEVSRQRARATGTGFTAVGPEKQFFTEGKNPNAWQHIWGKTIKAYMKPVKNIVDIAEC